MGRPPSDPDTTEYSGRFAARLRSLRAAHFDTVDAAATRMGVAVSVWASWEQGARFPRPDKLPALAATLKLKSVAELFPAK